MVISGVTGLAILRKPSFPGSKVSRVVVLKSLEFGTTASHKKNKRRITQNGWQSEGSLTDVGVAWHVSSPFFPYMPQHSGHCKCLVAKQPGCQWVTSAREQKTAKLDACCKQWGISSALLTFHVHYLFMKGIYSTLGQKLTASKHLSVWMNDECKILHGFSKMTAQLKY